jgi:hypothetical protein
LLPGNVYRIAVYLAKGGYKHQFYVATKNPNPLITMDITMNTEYILLKFLKNNGRISWNSNNSRINLTSNIG